MNFKYPCLHDLSRFTYKVIRRSNFKTLQEMRRVEYRGYTFRPFDETRSIFFHIPKGAGVSVCKSLYGNLAGGHYTARQYQRVFSKIDFDAYYKFTFVRNPWDRLFSAYTFLKAGGFNDCDADWYQANLSHLNSFEDFVMNWLSRRNILSYLHFKPQISFLQLYPHSKPVTDFIGYFENLNDDFLHVAQRVNPRGQLSHLNKTNNETGASYLQHYSKEMIKKVGQVYNEDIKALGYSFDNSSLERQIESRLSSKAY
jgi:hypothetical protein